MGISTLLPQTIGQVGDLTKIYNFLKPLIPTRYFKAIKILFTPCCELVISSVTVTCNDDSTYTVVVTLSNPPIFYDTPSWVLGEISSTPNGIFSWSSTTYSNGVITFTEVQGSGGFFPISVTALVPTSSDGNIGVYQTSNTIASVQFPSCS